MWHMCNKLVMKGTLLVRVGLVRCQRFKGSRGIMIPNDIAKGNSPYPNLSLQVEGKVFEKLGDGIFLSHLLQFRFVLLL